MGTAFNDGTDTAYDADNVRSFQSPPIVTAVEALSTAVIARLKKSGGTMSGTLTLSDGSTAASQSWVNSAIASGTAVPLASVALATTAAGGNITLSGEQTIDGTLTSSTRILVKDQSTGSQNGVYVTAAGAWSRAADVPAGSTTALVTNTSVYVTGGTANGGSTWQVTTTGTITVNTTATTWVQTDSALAAVADGSITLAKLASDSVNAAKIVDGSITSAELSSSLLDTSVDLDASSAADTKVPSQLAVRTFVQRAHAEGARASVFQLGGNTYAVAADTTVISSAATSAANNATVIQAAIDYIAGTFTDGHGGGGTVFLSDQNYSLGSYIELKPGVSLVGLGSFDRNATAQGGVPVSPNAHAFYGTTLTPTSALASFDVNPTGTTLTRNPVILVGRVRFASTTATASGTASASLPVADRTYFPQGTEDFGIIIQNGGSGDSATVTSGNGTGAGTFTITPSRTWANGDTIELDQQSTTNPHAIRIIGINIDCRNEPTAQGICIVDSQFVHVLDCNIANAYSSGGKAIEVYSSLAPDEGAHGTRIDGCQIANCYDGIYGSGSGSTDSLITNCRITQYGRDGISLTNGGWQISGCHITSGSGSQYSINCGAPSTIINNYLDTTGNYHLYLDAICTVQSNIMKYGGGSSQAALVVMTSNGYKSVISGNVVQLGASQLGFVKTSNSINSLSTNANWRPIITNNQVGDGGVATVTSPVIDSANAAIPEYPLSREYKSPVAFATTAALPACTYNNGAGTLTGNAVGALTTQDGITPTAGARMLVKNQSSALQNGIYTVTTVGDGATAFVLTRATDADAAGEIGYGTAVRVTTGSANAGKVFAVGTTGVITLGTTSITWYEDYPWPLTTTGSNQPNPRISGNVVVASGW